MNFIKTDNDSVLLGSGELYATLYNPNTNYNDIKTEDMVCLGYIKDNAELKTSLERKDIESANRGSIATIISKKVVEFSTGIFSYNLENVAKFLSGSQYIESDDKSKSTYYYADRDTTPQVVLRFISEDENNGIRVTVNMFRCQWGGDLSLNFNTEDPIEFDYTFKLLSAKMPNGKRGYFSVDTEVIAADSEDDGE